MKKAVLLFALLIFISALTTFCGNKETVPRYEKVIDNFEDGDLSEWDIFRAENGSFINLSISSDACEGNYSMKMEYGNSLNQEFSGSVSFSPEFKDWNIYNTFSICLKSSNASSIEISTVEEDIDVFSYKIENISANWNNYKKDNLFDNKIVVIDIKPGSFSGSETRTLLIDDIKVIE
jgi:peroxiredoxin